MVIDIFTAAVVISVALALAALTWRLQGYSAVPPVAAPSQSVTSSAADAAAVSALAPFGRSTGNAAVVGSGDVTLRAIFAAVPAAASVTLIAGPEGKVVPYAIGELTPAGVVEAIEPERVLLRSGSGLQVLSFDPAAAASSSGPDAEEPRIASVADLADPSAELPPPPPLPPPAARGR
nr:type II secretion system protein N [Alteripontixanthobacter muriae]